MTFAYDSPTPSQPASKSTRLNFPLVSDSTACSMDFSYRDENAICNGKISSSASVHRMVISVASSVPKPLIARITVCASKSNRSLNNDIMKSSKSPCVFSFTSDFKSPYPIMLYVSTITR